MDSVVEKLQKLREERLAREKARINKLKELNLKKYNKDDSIYKTNSNVSLINQSVGKTPMGIRKTQSVNTNQSSNHKFELKKVKIEQKTPIHVLKRQSCVVQKLKPNVGSTDGAVGKLNANLGSTDGAVGKLNANLGSTDGAVVKSNEQSTGNIKENIVNVSSKTIEKVKFVPQITKANKTLQSSFSNKAPIKVTNGLQNKLTGTSPLNVGGRVSVQWKIPQNTNQSKGGDVKKCEPKKYSRQSIIPRNNINKSLTNTIDKKPSGNGDTRNAMKPPQDLQTNGKRRESVFERLYKPKMSMTKHSNKLPVPQDKVLLNKTSKNAEPKIKKRMTMFANEPKPMPQNMRRSISAIHWKRISKSELSNCINKWSSIGEKINKAHMTDIQEDETVKKDAVLSVKSDRRKTGQYPKGITFNLNTPSPGELQSRLKSWLQKRGKSIESYHHLQCFGMHHLVQSEKENVNTKPFDDEDKENIEIPMVKEEGVGIEGVVEFDNRWRNANLANDSMDCNTSVNTTLGSDELPVHHVNELLLGALNDLSELLQEGFDWEQCARWLRALRERFPSAPNTAAYWECRAALEEQQGNFPGSVECWEQAIAKGTEKAIVEQSLDQLLDKFMQLKISPSAGKKSISEQKMVDVKNVFKSTLIRFAVQQAKISQSASPKYVATPVRRSSRLSAIPFFNGKIPTPMSSKRRTPLVQLCTSMKLIDEEVKNNLVFVSNKNLEFTP